MTTILVAFIASLILSLVLTPLAGRLGERVGALDVPSERKVHSIPTPRCGGLAIAVAFFSTLGLTKLITTDVSAKLVLDRQATFFLLGALMVFGVGLFDDLHRLGPKVKFLFQVVGASIAFWGGLRIEVFSVFGIHIYFAFLSYFITVFWFLLFINSMNLIDGLDGLAAGIAFFASAVLVVLSVMRGQYLIAMLFAALAGAVLGFLRYNFNPASIFMGDSGSYFLGYVIAGLSVMGSIKSQVGALMLIPVVALGVPVLDTILSPVRRFILGKKVFYPDNDHIHHRLREMGLSTKRVVWTIYGISLFLCAVSVALVNLRNEQAGLFLILLGAGAVIFIRKLGYIDYFTSDKIYRWFKDVTDEAGLTRDRRSFLSLQVQMAESRNLGQMWQNLCRAAERLEFDMLELHLCRRREDARRLAELRSRRSKAGGSPDDMGSARHWQKSAEVKSSGKDEGERTAETQNGSEDMIPGMQEKERRKNKNGGSLQWVREGMRINEDICSNTLLKLELPLISDNGDQCIGMLWMIKDIRRNNISHYTLKRIEHLRRTLNGVLTKLDGG